MVHSCIHSFRMVHGFRMADIGGTPKVFIKAACCLIQPPRCLFRRVRDVETLFYDMLRVVKSIFYGMLRVVESIFYGMLCVVESEINLDR